MTTVDPSQSSANPRLVQTREDLAEALTALRGHSGASVREIVSNSGGLHGTISGWFSGQHVPTKASTPMFDAVIRACGVDDPAESEQWHLAAARARRARSRRAASVPYRGLESFQASDTAVFFGREHLTDVLTRRVTTLISGHRVPLWVVGPPGSGKSSVLRAGLVPRIGVAGTELAQWRAVVLTPGSDPLTALAAAELDGTPTVLVIDQFEELWTEVSDADARASFLTRITEPDSDFIVVIGLRADFYGSAAAEPTLLDGLAAGPVVVGPMSDRELRRIIVEPARSVGGTVDDDLVQLLVDEITPTGGHSLPLLSHALLGTWNNAKSNRLTTADYFATGKISGAVQQSAEEVFAALSPARQAVAKRIFLRLVNVDEDVVSRRRARTEELFARGDSDDVDEVVEAFAGRRLLTIGEDTVEVSHEALLTAWGRLRSWIDEDRAGLVTQRQLAQATHLWQDSDRDDGTLLSGGRLSVAREWSSDTDHLDSLNNTEQLFLKSSIDAQHAEQEAEKRRVTLLRRLVSGLAVVTVVAVILAVTAFVAGRTASEQRVVAEGARNDAMSRQVATESSQLRDKDPALASQLALAAYTIEPTIEARSALLDSTATHSATRLVGPAGGMKARVSPDGTWIASASSDGMVRLWSMSDIGTHPEPIAVIPASDSAGPLFALAISNDGTLLATGGGGLATLWDLTEPTAPQQLSVLTDEGASPLQSLNFSPDGATLVGGDTESVLLRWDVRDPSNPVRLPTLQQPGSGRLVSAFSADGRYLATGGKRNSLRLWDARTVQTLTTPLFEVPAVPDSTNDLLGLAFAPDGSQLIAGTTGREVMQWSLADPATPKPEAPITGFGSYVNEVAYNAEGSVIAAVSSDNSTRLFRAADDVQLESLPGPSVVTSAEFVSDGSALVTAGVDGTTRIWPLPGPVLAGAIDSIFVTSVSEDGDTLIVGAGARDTGLPVWDISNPARAQQLPMLTSVGEDTFSGAVTQSTSGRLAAAGTSGGTVYLWDMSDTKAPRRLAGPVPAVDGIVGVVLYDPKERVLVTSAQDTKTMTVFDISDPAAPTVESTIDPANLAQMLSFSPDGNTLAVATADNTVELWDLSDPAAPERISTLGGFESYAQAVVFNSDGTLLAAGSADRSMRIFDVDPESEPRELAVVPELTGSVYSLSFSDSDSRLAAGLGSGEVLLFDLADDGTPTRFATLRAYPDRVYDAQFADGGRALVAGGPDKVIRVWSMDPVSARESLCTNVGTEITADEWERYLPGIPFRSLC